MRFIEVEVDWSWGWLKFRLIEVKVNLCCNLWNVFEVFSCRQITFILYDFLFSYFLILWYFGVIVSFFWAILGWFGGSKTVLWFTHVIEQLLFFSYSDFWLWLNFGVFFSFGGPNGLFLGLEKGSNPFWGLFMQLNNFRFLCSDLWFWLNFEVILDFLGP